LGWGGGGGGGGEGEGILSRELEIKERINKGWKWGVKKEKKKKQGILKMRLMKWGYLTRLRKLNLSTAMRRRTKTRKVRKEYTWHDLIKKRSNQEAKRRRA